MHVISPTFPNTIVLHVTSSYVPPTKPRGNVFGNMPKNRTAVRGTGARGQPKHCQELPCRLLPLPPSRSAPGAYILTTMQYLDL